MERYSPEMSVSTLPLAINVNLQHDKLPVPVIESPATASSVAIGAESGGQLPDLIASIGYST